MRDDEARSLLGAYALDAVDDTERRAVESLVQRDEEAARELATLRATVVRLAEADAATPPPALRDAVLAQVAALAAAAPTVTPSVPTRSGPARRRPGWASWFALAAAVAAGAVVPAAVAVQQAQRAEVAQRQRDELAQMLLDPSAQMVRQEIASGGTVTAVLTADAAVLMATGLPDPGADLVYQLWVIRDGEPVPAEVLRPDGTALAATTHDFTAGAALAVTVEPSGGSLQPTGDPVVVVPEA